MTFTLLAFGASVPVMALSKAFAMLAFGVVVTTLALDIAVARLVTLCMGVPTLALCIVLTSLALILEWWSLGWRSAVPSKNTFFIGGPSS